MTRLHLVNGFLGSGKTTAIVEAARQLLEDAGRGEMTAMPPLRVAGEDGRSGPPPLVPLPTGGTA